MPSCHTPSRLTACRTVCAPILLFAVFAGVGADDRLTLPGAELVAQPEAGLIWMRCSHGQRATDERCTGNAERLSWTQAQARVDMLASPDCPWRIPEFHELRGLMASGGEPALDPRAFPDTPDGWFWSNARAGGHSQHDCFVDFAGAGRTRCNMGGRLYLRAVMTGDATRAAACTLESAAR